MKFFLRKASAVLMCVLTLAGMAAFTNGAAATETDFDMEYAVKVDISQYREN